MITEEDDAGHRGFALDDGRGYIRGSETQKGVLFIGVMEVEPLYRSQGIGAMLLEEYERYLKGHKGIKTIYTRPANPRAYKFWYANGYRPRKGWFEGTLVKNL